MMTYRQAVAIWSAHNRDPRRMPDHACSRLVGTSWYLAARDPDGGNIHLGRVDTVDGRYIPKGS